MFLGISSPILQPFQVEHRGQPKSLLKIPATELKLMKPLLLRTDIQLASAPGKVLRPRDSQGGRLRVRRPDLRGRPVPVQERLRPPLRLQRRHLRRHQRRHRLAQEAVLLPTWQVWPQLREDVQHCWREGQLRPQEVRVGLLSRGRLLLEDDRGVR